jgi:hypothetical protein
VLIFTKTINIFFAEIIVDNFMCPICFQIKQYQMYKDNITSKELEQKTGIDLMKIEKKELEESVGFIIDAPFFIMLNLILWPLLFLVLFVFVGVWYIWPLSWGGAVLWIITGLIMGPITGLSIGAFVVAKILSSGSQKLYESSLGIMKLIAEDLKINYQKIPQNQPLPSFNDWVRIVRISIVLPVVSALIKNKLWPVGGGLARIVTVNFSQTTESGIKAMPTDSDSQKTYTKEELENYCIKLIESAEKMRKNAALVHKKATRITMAPLGFSVALTFILDLIILASIWFFIV